MKKSLYDRFEAAPLEVQNALSDFPEYLEYSTTLKNDIADVFKSPVLNAAINWLEELIISREKYYNTLNRAGFIINDAFKFKQYEEEQRND
jgi:hypothetical protein